MKTKQSLETFPKEYSCGCFGGPMMLCKMHAAAPDLLQSLKEANKQIHQWRESGKPDLLAFIHLQDKLRAVIAKAEGL